MIGAIGNIEQKLTIGGAGFATGSADRLASAAEAATGPSFTDLLAAAANRTVDTLNNAEAASVKALQGDADTREVVDAVMSAEQSLQAAVAIRDKIISAYLDVSRMAI
ncbi:flagellar hook-basal body complex protein FliE [Arvimicrobium flavum]|uniref:flagellar hook-basal body complex protein FliE n=1 Tax=Arvimicrobium flavum TaxID=3393320 RepID=UPI00237BA57A|nr:flagellar hook-basal body complex protein FliE [Mesorhizobium shangrilense]